MIARNIYILTERKVMIKIKIIFVDIVKKLYSYNEGNTLVLENSNLFHLEHFSGKLVWFFSLSVFTKI